MEALGLLVEFSTGSDSALPSIGELQGGLDLSKKGRWPIFRPQRFQRKTAFGGGSSYMTRLNDTA